MHYFLDGYNLLFRVDKEKKSLQKKREHVISVLSEEIKNCKISLTVVFDSMNTDEESRRSHKGPIEIVYTAKKQSADQYIIDAILHCKNPRIETVVTSDSQLAMQCRSCGANTQLLKIFCFFWQKNKKKPQCKKRSPSKRLPITSSGFWKFLRKNYSKKTINF